MDKLIPILDQFVQFLLKLLGNLGAFGNNEKLPDVIKQYYEDSKTVGEAIVK